MLYYTDQRLGTIPKCIEQYRESSSGLCSAEYKALCRREGWAFNSPEMRAIDRTCIDPGCKAEHHWCTTCLIAPRCSCMKVHMWPDYSPDGSRTWVVAQLIHIHRVQENVCDGRIGTFVHAIRDQAIANFEKSIFCKECRDIIRFYRNGIISAFGRTYREMASYIWARLDNNKICRACCDKFEYGSCVDSGENCPSINVPFTWDIIASYRPRKYRETDAIKKESTPSTQVAAIMKNVDLEIPVIQGSKFGSAYNTYPEELWRTLRYCKRLVQDKESYAI